METEKNYAFTKTTNLSGKGNYAAWIIDALLIEGVQKYPLDTLCLYPVESSMRFVQLDVLCPNKPIPWKIFLYVIQLFARKDFGSIKHELGINAETGRRAYILKVELPGDEEVGVTIYWDYSLERFFWTFYGPPLSNSITHHEPGDVFIFLPYNAYMIQE